MPKVASPRNMPKQLQKAIADRVMNTLTNEKQSTISSIFANGGAAETIAKDDKFNTKVSIMSSSSRPRRSDSFQPKNQVFFG